MQLIQIAAGKGVPNYASTSSLSFCHFTCDLGPIFCTARWLSVSRLLIGLKDWQLMCDKCPKFIYCRTRPSEAQALRHHGWWSRRGSSSLSWYGCHMVNRFRWMYPFLHFVTFTSFCWEWPWTHHFDEDDDDDADYDCKGVGDSNCWDIRVVSNCWWLYALMVWGLLLFMRLWEGFCLFFRLFSFCILGISFLFCSPFP